MTRLTFALICLAIACTSAWAAYDQPVYTVAVTKDVKYGEGALKSGKNMDLLLDVYTPTESKETKRPAMLVIHGGGFTGGSRAMPTIVNAAQFFTSRGFVSFSMDYRLEKDTPPDAPAVFSAVGASSGRAASKLNAVYAALMDTASAIRWIHANAAKYGLDPDSIYALGSSAGAYCVVMVGVANPDRFHSPNPANNPNEPQRLRGILDFWGSAAHFVTQIDANDPPICIIHGTEDPTVAFKNAEAIVEQAKKVNLPYEFYPLKGEGHAAWNATVNGKSLLQISLEFLHAKCGLGSKSP